MLETYIMVISLELDVAVCISPSANTFGKLFSSQLRVNSMVDWAL